MARRPRHRREDESDIRREARVVGLRGVDMPSLEDVEHRRLQLWLIMAVILVAVTAAMVVLSLWQDDATVELFVSPLFARCAILVLVAGFAAYAVEKELHLRRLTGLLLEERVLVTALSNRLSEMTSLLEAGRAMNSVLEIGEVLARILDNALELLGAETGSVMLADGDELRVVCVRGDDRAVGTTVAWGQGVAGRVAERREALLIQGEVDEGWRGRTKRDEPVQSAMSLPLIHRDELLGVLNVNACATRAFTEYDLRALSLFGEHAASAVANARLYEVTATTAEHMTHQALHDPLTGLANRTLFDDRVGHALGRRRGRGTEVAVLFVDLDDFKRVNDTWGHAAGDELLRAVASRLRASVRDGDTPCRYGGDEFAILVDEVTGPEPALRTAERVLVALADPIRWGGGHIEVQASVGVALSDRDDLTTAELLRRADAAMYRAKGDGKSCVRLHHPDATTEIAAAS